MATSSPDGEEGQPTEYADGAVPSPSVVQNGESASGKRGSVYEYADSIGGYNQASKQIACPRVCCRWNPNGWPNERQTPFDNPWIDVRSTAAVHTVGRLRLPPPCHITGPHYCRRRPRRRKQDICGPSICPRAKKLGRGARVSYNYGHGWQKIVTLPEYLRPEFVPLSGAESMFVPAGRR